MRKEPTPAERKLWHALRNWQLDGLKFRRQMPIGRYIVDFYCSSACLVVEVDGATHTDSIKDHVRDAWLLTQGIHVVRIWNNEVMDNLSGVIATITAAARPPPPGPLPQGEGEKS
jgi:very-short-patch-repair endonuclease